MLPITTAINFLWWGHCTSSPYEIPIQRLWFCHVYFHIVYPRIGSPTGCESLHPSQSGRLRLRFACVHLPCSRCEAVSWRWLFWRLRNSLDWLCSAGPEYRLKVLPESTFLMFSGFWSYHLCFRCHRRHLRRWFYWPLSVS